jgi:hypothetical protein
LSLDSFLSTIVRLLDEARVPYMLTGSLAAAYYSSPRATQDLDLVIDPTAEQVDTLVESLLAEGFYVNRDAARQAFRARGQFNVIDPESGWKADLILRKDRPFSVSEFGRRAEATLLGMEIALTSVEDLIVAKLEWSEIGDSELQRRDLAQLMESAGADLDRDYIETWVRQLGLESAWDRASGRA